MSSFHFRLKQLRGDTPQAKFASEMGVPQTTFGRYERGDGVPDIDFVMTLCAKLGVEPRWLLFGDGPVYSQERTTIEPARAGILRAGDPLAKVVVRGGLPQDASGADTQSARRGDPLDADLLETVIEVVEEVLEDSGRELAPDKKAKLIVAIYDLYQDSEREVDKASVLRLVKSVA